MGCLKGLGKAYLILINALAALGGVAVAAYAFLLWEDEVAGASAIPRIMILMILSLGAFMFLTAAIGLGGAWFHKRAYVYTYLFIVILCMIYNITVAVYIYYEKANAQDSLSAQWASVSSATRGKIQDEFQCCGFADPTDRSPVSKFCPQTATLDITTNSTGSTTPVAGCFPKLLIYAETRYPQLYTVLFAVVLIEVVGFLNACVMLCVVRNAKEDTAERWKRRKSAMKLEENPEDLKMEGWHDVHLKDGEKKFGKGNSPYKGKKDDVYERSWVDLAD